LILQQESAEPFAACPFCLTKIVNQEVEAEKPESEQPELTPDKLAANKENPSGCRYHIGYLSERGEKQGIPDDCIVCKDIIECMLQKMKKE